MLPEIYKENSKINFIKIVRISSFKKLSNKSFEIDNYNEDLDIIEFYIKNKNGVKSKKSFLSINKQNPYDIKGEIYIRHVDNGIIIEFHEEEHSGYTPNLEITSDDKVNNYSLYRKEKNILSSKIININGMQNISIVYNTQPEIVFDKKVTTLSSLNQNQMYFNGYKIELTKDSFYNDMLIICNEEIEYKLDGKFSKASIPIIIKPNEIPFKKGIKLEYNISDCNHCGFYKFSYEDEKWYYVNTTNNSEKVSTDITNGGTFCVLSEKQQPTINNLKPSLNSKYRKQDLKDIVFNVNDILSGINPYDIKIKIDGKELFYDYIKYRNLVSADLNQILSKGAHTIELSVSDKVNNINTITGQFLVVE